MNVSHKTNYFKTLAFSCDAYVMSENIFLTHGEVIYAMYCIMYKVEQIKKRFCCQ